MTDRINALTVVLDRDYRDDDIAEIIVALQMVRGVVSVKENVTDLADAVAHARVDRLWRDRLVQLAKEGVDEYLRQ